MKELAARLRERRAEIEQATLARVHAVSDPVDVEDPEYVLGLKDAVGNGLDYAIAELEAGYAVPAPVPMQLLGQARAAARNGISLDTVLRRYSVGYTLLGDFLIEEASAAGVSGEELKRALRAQGTVYDRLMAAISTEYTREARGRVRTTGHRRAEMVKMLLTGDPVDPLDLRYSLEHWHLAALARGLGAAEYLREFAAVLDCQPLAVEVEGSVWSWWGGRSRLSAREVLSLAAQHLPSEMSLTVGEPGEGLEGWRLSHRQAKAAMSVAQRGYGSRVRYADVALIASALRDDVLASSLRHIYLAPLEAERDGGAALREALSAYFAAGRNVSSAAAKLGINRQTVSIRLRVVEERIGRSLDTCAAEAEVALRLRELSEA